MNIGIAILCAGQRRFYGVVPIKGGTSVDRRMLTGLVTAEIDGQYLTVTFSPAGSAGRIRWVGPEPPRDGTEVRLTRQWSEVSGDWICSVRYITRPRKPARRR